MSIFEQKIVFDAETHSYHLLRDDTALISVSELLDSVQSYKKTQYFEIKANNSAQKSNYNKIQAINKGVLFHEKVHQFISKHNINASEIDFDSGDADNPEINSVLSGIKQILNKCYGDDLSDVTLWSESVLYSKKYHLAGTADLIALRERNEIVVIDYKTNAMFSPNYIGNYEPPIGHLPDIDIVRYKLQVGLYAFLASVGELDKFFGSKCFILHSSGTIYESLISEYSDSILALLEFNKNNHGKKTG